MTHRLRAILRMFQTYKVTIWTLLQIGAMGVCIYSFFVEQQSEGLAGLLLILANFVRA